MLQNRRVVVVGTGPAGATAAVFLSRAGLEPLVLEAGSAKAGLGLTARIRGLTVAKIKPPLTRRRDVTNAGDPAAELYEVLAPGGLSNQWACAVPRFAPDDFRDAARAGEAATWPIDYAELVPFYERVEPLLRIAGASREVPALPAGKISVERALGEGWAGVVHAAEAIGRDVVAMPYAFGGESTLTRSATPFNAYTRLIKPIEQHGGLSVRHDTQVLRLVWSSTERRVTAVVCRDVQTGGEIEIPCRAVVLAAGAVNSAQILLESANADFPDGLGNTHGVLGRYLHDHPLAKVVLDLCKPIQLVPASYITRPKLERTRPLYAAACMQWTSAREIGRALVSTHPGRTTELGFSIFGTMAPIADNYVALDRTRGGAGERAPLLMALRHPPEALAVLEHTKNDLLDVFERAGFEPRLRVFKIEPPGNSVHYGGTCRMHASARFGVVDRDSRVFDVPNVVVGDSAVFTTGPEKNPVLTAMALAARASGALAEDLRGGDL